MAILLTTIEPAPAGFELVCLTKRHLLSGPVAVLVPDTATLSCVLDTYTDRMVGVIITVSDDFSLEHTSALLWHARLPAPWLNAAAALAQGWLAAIAIADDAKQRAYAADFRIERLGRELEVTRRDYNELTTRLQARVRDLMAAKNELSTLNDSLEMRVAERTEQLGQANQHLSKALEDLKLAQNELIRTAELAGLGSLVAGVAHELNTPIGNALTVATSLANEAQLLKSKYENGILKRSSLDQYVQVTENITAILEKNLIRAADIVGQFKQLTADQTRENRHEFKLLKIVADTISGMDLALRETPFQVRIEVDPSIEMVSYPNAITRILAHFVSNALIHAFDGRNHGTMTIHAVMHDNDTVELSFSDDGNGIAADQVPRVFDPFFTTKFGRGSSGLSLYSAYNEAKKLLDGRLSVTSNIGAGTCFQLRMARVAADHPNLLPQAYASSAGPR